MTFRCAEDRWEPWHVEVAMLNGPDRIYDNDHTEDTHRRPAGFMPDWTPDPQPWCATCCTKPDGCACAEVVSVPANIREGMGTE